MNSKAITEITVVINEASSLLFWNLFIVFTCEGRGLDESAEKTFSSITKMNRCCNSSSLHLSARCPHETETMFTFNEVNFPFTIIFIAFVMVQS